MAKITTRAGLNVGTELTIDEATSTFTLNVAGNLIAKDGVTLQALYSKFVELWATAPYQDSEFPMYAIDALSGQFQFGTDGSTFSGWRPADDATRQMLRDGGWSEYNAMGVLTRQYVGIVSLGDVNAGAQLYYQRAATDAPSNFTFDDEVNEGIQVYGDPSNGNFDKRTYFKGFVREYGKKYKDSVLADTGKTATGAYLVNLLLSNEDDLDILKPDAYVAMSVSVASATWSAGIATFNTGTAHGLTSDDIVVISGITPSGYNVRGACTVIDADTFTVPVMVDPTAYVSGGTVGSIYSKIGVKYFSTPFSKDIDTSTDRNFGIVIDAGTHSGVDGSMSASGSTLTTTAGGIDGADFVGGILKVWGGANAGEYVISGTPSATAVTITGTFPSTESGASFTLYPADELGASLQQIYTKIQYLLRQNTDIDSTSGTVTGKTAAQLLNFVGPDLKAGFFAPTNPNGGGSGVLVEGIRDADLNTITFYDNLGIPRVYPYASAGTISFNSVLVGGGSSYRLMFTTLPGAGNDYGEAGAVTVNDADGNPIAGTISSGVISFTFDYDGNTQGGRTPGTDAAVTLIGIKPGTGKFAVTTGTLSRSKSIALSLVAEQDRAYI